MLVHRCAARVLAPSAARPRILPGANALYARHGPPNALLRPVLAPRVQRRTFILEPLGSAFLAIHSFTGVPWWLLAPSIGFVCTVALHLPFHVLERRQAARAALISPLVSAWAIKIRHLKLENPAAAFERQQKRIIREAKFGNMTMLKSAKLLTSLAGATVGFRALESAMFVTAADAVAVEPSFVTGGLLWFPNLAAADPLGILPVVMGAMISFRSIPRSMAELQLVLNPTAPATSSTRMKRFQLFIGPTMAITFMNSAAGVVLFLTGSSAAWLLIPLLHRYLNRYLPPVPKNPWLNNAASERWYIEGPPIRK